MALCTPSLSYLINCLLARISSEKMLMQKLLKIMRTSSLCINFPRKVGLYIDCIVTWAMLTYTDFLYGSKHTILPFQLFTCRQQLSSEKRLVRKLLKNYEKIGRVRRPVRNVTTTVPVVFGLGLIQMSLDETKHKTCTCLHMGYKSLQVNILM